MEGKNLKKAVEIQNGVELKESILKYEKLEQIKEETYERRDYLDNLSMSGARMLFRLRTRTF